MQGKLRIASALFFFPSVFGYLLHTFVLGTFFDCAVACRLELQYISYRVFFFFSFLSLSLSLSSDPCNLFVHTLFFLAGYSTVLDSRSVGGFIVYACL
jgi:hypothetical protein